MNAQVQSFYNVARPDLARIGSIRLPASSSCSRNERLGNHEIMEAKSLIEALKVALRQGKTDMPRRLNGFPN